MAAMEYQVQFLPPNNVPPPTTLEFTKQPAWEIAFNPFPRTITRRVAQHGEGDPTDRPMGAELNHMVWETFTHGDVGDIGLPPLVTGRN